MNTATLKLGYYSAIISFMAVTGYGLVQILQVAGLLASPLDNILIFGFSLAIAPSFLLTVLALHYSIPNDKKIWSHAALLFAVLYCANAFFIYTTQLATVIPLSASGTVDDVLIVKPHSLFWTVDAVAYFFMSLSALFLSLSFKKDGEDKRVKYALLAHGLVIPFFSIAYFYSSFSTWVLYVGSPWLLTALASTYMLTRYFKRKINT